MVLSKLKCSSLYIFKDRPCTSMKDGLQNLCEWVRGGLVDLRCLSKKLNNTKSSILALFKVDV